MKRNGYMLIVSSSASQCFLVHSVSRSLRMFLRLEVDEDTTGIPKFNQDWRHKDAEGAVLSTCSSLVVVVDHGGE